MREIETLILDKLNVEETSQFQAGIERLRAVYRLMKSPDWEILRTARSKTDDALLQQFMRASSPDPFDLGVVAGRLQERAIFRDSPEKVLNKIKMAEAKLKSLQESPKGVLP